MTATVTFNRTPETSNEKWYVANREKYSLGIEASDEIYSGGEYIHHNGLAFFNPFTGCSSRDFDICLGKLREYIEGDHQ